MANSNWDDSFTHNQSATKFLDWQLGLDFDDEEFRAGYPFSDISVSEFDESCDFLNTSSDQNDNRQSNDSYGDDSVSIERETEQINNDLYEEEEEEEEMNDNQKYDTIGYNMDSQEITINELNIEEHHHDNQNLRVENGNEKEDR